VKSLPELGKAFIPNILIITIMDKTLKRNEGDAEVEEG
jgi:hypothetical protein